MNKFDLIAIGTGSAASAVATRCRCFLYCSIFSLGIAFNWTVGTIVGCATGGPAGVWLGRKAADGLKL